MRMQQNSNTFEAVHQPEQERFFRNMNGVIDRNPIELTILEGYGKYRVWKGFFNNGFVQAILMLSFLGITITTDKLTKDGGWSASFVVGAVLIAMAWAAWQLLWKVYQLITWPIRLWRSLYDPIY